MLCIAACTIVTTHIIQMHWIMYPVAEKGDKLIVLKNHEKLILIKSFLSPRNLEINSLAITQMIMYTNEYSCAMLATQAQWGLFSIFGNSSKLCHQIKPHSSVLQIAKTFWPGSFKLCQLVNCISFTKTHRHWATGSSSLIARIVNILNTVYNIT